MTTEPPRVLPHNMEAEQALLGAILVNNDAFRHVNGFLRAEHFFEPVHRYLYTNIAVAIADGRAASPVTLKDVFSPKQKIGDLTGRQYMARLAAEATGVVMAADYGAVIVDLAMKRELVGRANEITEAAFENKTPAIEIISSAERAISEVRNGARTVKPTDAPIGEVVGEIIQSLDRPPEQQGRVTPTGLADLDRKIGGGWRGGRLYVMAGRPGSGKSVLMVSSARRGARREFGQAIFSMELDRHEVGARFVASELSVSDFPVAYSNILSGKLEDAHKARIRDAHERFAKMPIHVDDAGGLAMAEIEARARIVQDRFERADMMLGVVWIDYLQLVRATDRYKGRKNDERGEIALAAKEMAKRLNVAVVLLSQLNRNVESREIKRPFMSDLRDSGEIEEHADVVGLLYRQAYYIQQDPKYKAGDENLRVEFEDAKHDLELDLGKNRLGPVGTIKLHCDVALSAVNDRAGY